VALIPNGKKSAKYIVYSFIFRYGKDVAKHGSSYTLFATVHA
jgi:hypothetical protein